MIVGILVLIQLMSLKSNFRIRPRDTLARGSSHPPPQQNWFDYLKQRKLNCKRTLDHSYDTLTLQQNQLRSVIRGNSVDCMAVQKQNNTNQNQIISTIPQHDKHHHHDRQPSRDHSSNNTIRNTLRALKQQRAAEQQSSYMVPTKIDNFKLNTNLVSKLNDTIWNKISYNPRQKQVLLFKAHDLNFGRVRGCCFKITKCHKKYIVKVFNLEEKFGVVIGKAEWEGIWERSRGSYEEVMRNVELLPQGKIRIKCPETEISEDCTSRKHEDNIQ